MRTITVTRNRGWYGRIRTAIILADDVEIGRVKSGETVNVEVPDHANNLYVKVDWGRSSPYPASNLKEGDTIYMNAWFTLNPLRNLAILPLPIALEQQPR